MRLLQARLKISKLNFYTRHNREKRKRTNIFAGWTSGAVSASTGPAARDEIFRALSKDD